MSTPSTGPFIVSLDVGSSSVRALLFDAQGRQMEGYEAKGFYDIAFTPDGGAEVDPGELLQSTIGCLDDVHRRVHAAGLPVAAVAGSAFWHSFCGVGDNGRPTLPIFHLLDTRSVRQVAQVPNTHARTGCVPHSSYWPAKLLWLEQNRPKEFRATRQWLSFPELLFQKVFGHARASTSMVSGTGLWDQNANDYDQETLSALTIRREQLADPASFDEPECEFLPKYRDMWPGFKGAKWFPALGDGACNNIGSGCASPGRAALTVGTTGAMRIVVEAQHTEIFPSLWCYRADARRFVIGGALSNGGDVYAWMKRTLALSKDTETLLGKAVPGSHRLTVLPFFSGERTPYWRADLRAAIIGLSASTMPWDILRASLESVALRFREIYELLEARGGAPSEVVASGGALLHSPAWTQMMADALGRPVVACTEPEPSSRGAALWALERLGMIATLDEFPASTGAVFHPRPQYAEAYKQLLSDQRNLYERLFNK